MSEPAEVAARAVAVALKDFYEQQLNQLKTDLQKSNYVGTQNHERYEVEKKSAAAAKQKYDAILDALVELRSAAGTYVRATTDLPRAAQDRSKLASDLADHINKTAKFADEYVPF